MNNDRRRINWFGILTGVLFVIAAFSIFSQPLESLISLAFLFGILAWINAVTTTITGIRAKQEGLVSSNWWMLNVVFDVIIGIIFIFHIGLGITTIGIFFAIWFIFDAIGEIMLARVVNTVSRSAYIVTMIFGVLGLILGLILLFIPAAADTVLVYTIAFYLVVFGVSLIARSL